MVRVNACKVIIDFLSTMAGVNAPLHWFNGNMLFSHVSCSKTAANYLIDVISLFKKISDSDDVDHLVSLNLCKSQPRSLTSPLRMSLFKTSSVCSSGTERLNRSIVALRVSATHCL